MAESQDRILPSGRIQDLIAAEIGDGDSSGAHFSGGFNPGIQGFEGDGPGRGIQPFREGMTADGVDCYRKKEKAGSGGSFRIFFPDFPFGQGKLILPAAHLELQGIEPRFFDPGEGGGAEIRPAPARYSNGIFHIFSCFLPEALFPRNRPAILHGEPSGRTGTMHASGRTLFLI